jgi:pimeloyl-ACP methyl ester carboxylesterase
MAGEMTHHEECVEFDGDGVRLSGTIAVPADTPPVPRVVLIGGSGPADRHNDGLFDALRDAFVDDGMAVLTYDKRGVGGSTGDWASATVDQLARDAAAGLSTLRSHPRVVAEAVGILGHSEGGWVALRVCARFAQPRYLVVTSCPAVSFLESEVSAATRAGMEHGAARRLFEELRKGSRGGRDAAAAQQILVKYRNGSRDAALDDAEFVLDPARWRQFAAWADYDPSHDLDRVATPTLAVFGADDPLVPVQASAEHFDATATRAGRIQQTLVMPQADHRLRSTGEMAGFGRGYPGLLIDWCRACTESRSS